MAFRKLLAHHGYKLEPTGADDLWQNEFSERPNQSIAMGIRSMLYWANMPSKFWDYAFYHYIRGRNVSLHGRDDKAPFEQVTGIQTDLRLWRTFGCHVWICPSGKRKHKLDNHVNKGIFLGYIDTLKNIYFYDVEYH